MVTFIPLDIAMLRDIFALLNDELLTWIAEQFRSRYQLDARAIVGQTISAHVDTHIDDYMRLRPPDGVIYLLEVDGAFAGMGALRTLSDPVGEIKRMYIRPPYRGHGYGTELVPRLLDAGRAFGCVSFLLETSKFMTVAQHLYTAAGFVGRGAYPESEAPPVLRPYQRFMEKTESTTQWTSKQL
jgi:GNAT superfamily N-acetyltransferase